MNKLSRQLWTVWVFTRLNTKRFFRDKLAIFFTILFPLIFLFVFGSFSSSNSGNVSFKVAVINQSKTEVAKQFDQQITKSKVFKVNPSITTINQAKDKISKNQLDGIIVLPPTFGELGEDQTTPTGKAIVMYGASAAVTGQTLTTVLDGSFKAANAKFQQSQAPFTVASQAIRAKSLTAFDYTFAGLLGFSIVGIGIFGPMNVFPELKKQGILRRLHTTPLKVWQYFMSTMFSQAATGVVAIAIQFAVAIGVFHLKINGNPLAILIFSIYSIFMILGIGLAIGGWAKNERQAAPLGNIIVFPMLFLSGTFFPRYAMPHWLQGVSDYLPLTPVIDGLRQLITEGKSLLQIGPEIALIAIWFVIIYAIAFRVFKWE